MYKKCDGQTDGTDKQMDGQTMEKGSLCQIVYDDDMMPQKLNPNKKK